MTVENMILGNVETFKELCEKFVENADCIEASYDVSPDNMGVEFYETLVLRINTDFQMQFFYNDKGRMNVYIESQIDGKLAEIEICDGAECDTRLYMSKYINFKQLEKDGYSLSKVGTIFKPVKTETITQSVARIEENIYNIDYDALSDYLKGIRDFMNLLNGTENNKQIADYIISELRQYDDFELPF